MRWLLFPYIVHHLVTAIPNIHLPINAQVPPVARANEPFTFKFSDSTFTSASTISYTLSNAPQWLTLDGVGRTLSGIPASENAGSTVVDLIAEDTDGSVLMPFTLVVLNEAGPHNGLDVANQLPAYGAFSSPNRILLAPSSTLSISFSPHTFTNTNEHTVYYATMSDHTPLPSWICFDPLKLAFIGSTPGAISSQDKTQHFGIQLAASNVVGFADARTEFVIVVESHLFTFRCNTLIINVTAGSSVDDSTIAAALLLHGHRASNFQVTDISTSKPSWLRLDPSTLKLSGTAPADFKGENFTLTVTDEYGDSASVTLMIQAKASPTTSLLNPIGTANAIRGTDFVYHIGQTVNASNLDLSVDLGSASGWLEFDNVRGDIRGHVPSDLRSQQVVVNITASLQDERQSEILTIAIQNAVANANNPLPSGAGVSRANPLAPPPQSPKPRSGKPWIAAIVTPCSIVAALSLFFGVRYYKRGKRRRDAYRNSCSGSSKRYIPQPLAQEKRHVVLDADAEHAMTAPQRPSRFSIPPQLPLPAILRIPSQKRQSRGRSSKLFSPDIEQRTSCRPLSEGFLNGSRLFSLAPSDFSPIPEEASTKQSSQQAGPAVPPLRTPISNILKGRMGRSTTTIDSPEVLYTQLIRGFGHGKPDPSRAHRNVLLGSKGSRSIEGPFGQVSQKVGPVRRPWKDAKDSDSSGEWTTESGSSNNGDRRIKRPTIRTVSRASTSSWPDTSSPLPIPQSVQVRESTKGFTFGASIRGRQHRYTRSRSSSLNPPKRPNPESLSNSYPKFIAFKEDSSQSRARHSFTGNDPRFQSALPSEVDSVKFEYEDDMDCEDVRPGLSIAEHRQSTLLTCLPNRFTRMDPATDDKSTILGDEETSIGSQHEGPEEEQAVSMGEKLARKIGHGKTDPANKSMRGRIEEAGSFSTEGAEPRRSDSKSFV